MVRTGLTVLRRPLVVRTRPLHFQLEPATGCNLLCQTCQVPDYGPEQKKNLTLDQFRDIFDQIRPIKVALSGAGEPFLNPDLLGIVRHAKEHGASVLTTTNFTLCSKRIEEIVDSGLDLIKISLDAATPATYEKVRGRPFFDRILRDIESLQRVKAERGSATPYVRLQFVLQADNLEEIVPMVELAARLKANSVYFQPLETLLIADRKEALTKGVEFEDLKGRLVAARDRAEEVGLGTNAGVLVRSLPSYFRKYEPGVPKEPPSRVCLLPWFSLYITVDGDVRPCCSFGEGETLVLGNLFRERFDDIWNNEKYQNLRRQSLACKLGYTVCRNCTPNRLRDFVRLAGVLPGFLGSASSVSSDSFEG
jgi:radical SAM protein with 4Fe4S-binding SPASM domain